MSQHNIRIETEPKCLSHWQQPWARRHARVTLLINSNDQIIIVRVPSNPFWFLPGGGTQQSESIEDAAKREALEELGIEIKINRAIATYNVTLASNKTAQEIKIPPFIALHATHVGGTLKEEYAKNRKIVLIKKDECADLLRDFEIPRKYECMRPYLSVSKEIIRELLISPKQTFL